MEKQRDKNMNTKEMKSERKVVNRLQDLFLERKPSGLRKLFVHTNLATKRFHEIWSEWWKTAVPPRLEVDMTPVFGDLREVNKVFMVGVEVEFFKNRTKNFYDGLQQALSFGLFGFDSLVLWHIFSEQMENKIIDEYVKPVKEIVEGLKLPIVYIATKLTQELQFEFFAPWELYSSSKMDGNFLLTSMRDLCYKARNPCSKKRRLKEEKGY
jgi:hypothetical protein